MKRALSLDIETHDPEEAGTGPRACQEMDKMELKLLCGDWQVGGGPSKISHGNILSKSVMSTGRL